MKSILKYLVFGLWMTLSFSKLRAQINLQDGLVAAYDFNGNANDASGNSNNGSVVGASLTFDRFGNANSAYNFNGNGNYIVVPNSSSLNQNFTTLGISFWTKWDPIVNSNTNFGSNVFDKVIGGAGHGFFVDILNGSHPSWGRLTYSNALRFASTTVSSVLGFDFAPYDNNVAVNQWQHNYVQFSNGKVDFYINGILNFTSTALGTTIDNNTLDLYIGSNESGLRSYKGDLDDIRIYNRTLLPSEVKKLYSDTLSNYGPISFQPCGNSIIRIDTSSEYLNMGTGYNFTNQFTMMAWVRMTDTSNKENSIIFSKHISSSYNSSWIFYIAQRKPTVNITKPGPFSYEYQSDSILNTDWHHLAATYNGIELIIFVDGKIMKRGPASGNLNNTNLQAFIGAVYKTDGISITSGNNTDYDECALFNIALTQDIIKLYKKGIPSNANGMVAYFNFNNSDNNFERNIVSTSPNATISGNVRMGSFSNPSIILKNNKLVVENPIQGISYNWYINNTIVGNNTNEINGPFSTGKYKVNSNINNCSLTSEVYNLIAQNTVTTVTSSQVVTVTTTQVITVTSVQTIKIYECPTLTGANQRTENEQIEVFPNPSSGGFSIVSQGSEINRVEILNSYGTLLKVFDNMSKIDVTDLTRGTYFLKAYTQSGYSKTVKVLLE
ncbi:MAG: LamG-like jellyroll fold domain-containing protein [Bacteroidota bacterium]|nr:LamG-like jellyroll fold domain-containing protein [Bacteroidota bacterium]